MRQIFFAAYGTGSAHMNIALSISCGAAFKSDHVFFYIQKLETVNPANGTTDGSPFTRVCTIVSYTYVTSAKVVPVTIRRTRARTRAFFIV